MLASCSTCDILCVPYIFANSARCRLTVAPCDGLPTFVTGINQVFHCDWINCLNFSHNVLCLYRLKMKSNCHFSISVINS